MDTLIYRPHAQIEDLQIGECTMHRASNSSAARWWQLWFNVLRDTDQQPEIFCVPVNPNGFFTPNGPGGKTWGLNRSTVDEWQIYPSINVEFMGNAHENLTNIPSIWHHTPKIICVPQNEPWITLPP